MSEHVKSRPRIWSPSPRISFLKVLLGQLYLAKIKNKMAPPIESPATQTIATIAFGILASCISIFTAWQGYRTWRKLFGQGGGRPAGSDLESRDYTPRDWPSMSLLISTKQLASNSKVAPYIYPTKFLSFRQHRSQTLRVQRQTHQLRQKKRDFSIRLQHQPQVQLRQFRIGSAGLRSCH